MVRRSLLALVLILMVGPAFGQMTNAEAIATLTGRIIGAAKACGVDGRRLSNTGARVFALVNARAGSERERGAATALFSVAYEVGIKQVASGKIRCQDARHVFEDTEARFAPVVTPPALS